MPIRTPENFAAHRKPSLCALCRKKQHQQKTPLAQQYSSSLVIPCAHGKLNVKHHWTTPKPATHTSITAEKDKAALARKKLYTAPRRTQAEQQQQQCEYIHTCIQARPISTNPRSMGEECEYGLPSGTCFTARRLEVVAIAGLQQCCGYISWCVFLVPGGISFFFSFSLLRTHTAYCKYEATSCLIYLSTSSEARTRERIDRGRFLPLGKKASS